MAQPLSINAVELNKYNQIKTKLDSQDIPVEAQMAYELALMALTSKQCNEPYENLLAACLGLTKLDTKHGWDAVNNVESPTEMYEFKPSECTTKKKSPSGTINDDSIAKIEKCEHLEKEGKKGWLILAGIDKTAFNFSVIYKFPIDVFNQDRRAYLQGIIEKNIGKANKGNANQTRVTYPVNVKRAVALCQHFGQTYYIWNKLI